MSKGKAQTQLHLAARQCSGERQRLAGEVRGCPMHVEGRSKIGTHYVVYRRVVCAVCQVETFRCELQIAPFPQVQTPAQANIECCIIRSQPTVAGSAREKGAEQ